MSEGFIFRDEAAISEQRKRKTLRHPGYVTTGWRLSSVSVEIGDQEVYVYLLLPPSLSNPSQGYPSFKFASAHLYTYTSVGQGLNLDHCIRSPTFQPLAASAPVCQSVSKFTLLTRRNHFFFTTYTNAQLTGKAFFAVSFFRLHYNIIQGRCEAI